MRRLSFFLVPLILMAGCDSFAPDRSSIDPLSGSVATVSSRGPGFIDVVVRLREEVNTGSHEGNMEKAAAVAQELGLEPRYTYGTALIGFAGSVPEARLNALRSHPLVLSVEFDRIMSLPDVVMEANNMSTLADPATTQVVPWGIGRVGVHEAPHRGQGVHVYVLDTGIDPSHPDIGPLGEGFNVFNTECKGNPKNCLPPQPPDDDRGHGTHVAGTIGARSNGIGVVGVAPEVTLHAVKVLDSQGQGSWSGIIKGVDWVTSHNTDRPRVANMSLGGVGSRVGECTSTGPSSTADALHAALCNARNAGVVVIAAAGNSGSDASGFIPAAFFDAVITVSATGCTSRGYGTEERCDPGTEHFPEFSNWGTKSDGAWASEGSLPVLIGAPGRWILSTLPGSRYAYYGGTSMASPHVAGAAAIILGQSPGLRPTSEAFSTVRTRLLGNAECSQTWWKPGGKPHDERFLNVRGTGPINECVVPTAPPLERLATLEATEVTTESVTLSWTRADSYEYSDLTYQVFQVISDRWVLIDELPDGTNSYLVTGLKSGTDHIFGARPVRKDDDVYLDAGIMFRVDVKTEGVPGEPLKAWFTYDCGNSATCRFTSTSTGDNITWYSWTMGDGRMYTGVSEVSHTYTDRGSFRVFLEVSDGHSNNTTWKTITCEKKGRIVTCQ
jgi:subtilisin